MATDNASRAPGSLTHEFDSSRTCNYCGIAAERVPGNADAQPCPARNAIRPTPSPGSLTPEERAEKVFDEWEEICTKPGAGQLVDRVAAAIRAAVAEALESVALHFDECHRLDPSEWFPPKSVAEHLRARKS